MTTAKDAVQFTMFNASNEDLNDLINAIKFRRAQLARGTVQSLRIGAKVKFTSSKRGTITGKVLKIGRKNVQVQADNAATVWRVPANMLSTI